MTLKNGRVIDILWLPLALVLFLSTGCDIVIGVQRTGTHNVVEPQWPTGWPSPTPAFPFSTPTLSPQTALPTPTPSPTTSSCPEGDYNLQFGARAEEVVMLVNGQLQPQRWTLAQFKEELLALSVLEGGERLQPAEVKGGNKALKVISGGQVVGWVEVDRYVVRTAERPRREVSPRWYYSRCRQWHK